LSCACMCCQGSRPHAGYSWKIALHQSRGYSWGLHAEFPQFCGHRNGEHRF
jgi:hypothetical protein